MFSVCYTGFQEFAGLPGVGFDAFTSNYQHPSEVQELVDVSAINSDKQTLINLNEQPITVHRRQYSKPQYDATVYKKRKI